MKTILPVLIFPFLITSCVSSQKKETIFDPIVLKAKETSLYAQQVNWEEVNAKFIELTEGKQRAEDMKEGLQYLLNSLGDKHGAFRLLKDYSILVSYTGDIKEKDNRDSEFVNTVINDVSAKFSYKILENNIGYLKVVAIGSGSVKEQADFIRAGLIDLKEKGVEKWILDLRFNGGGNMAPMIAGLAPLIGEGYIGGAVNDRNELTREYWIKNGQFDNTGRVVCKMKNSPKIPSTEKVAILLSRYTISSGEMLAISFKGRNNVKFIGEETAGYTTGNGFDQVNDELALVISQDVFMDRNKIRYDNKVGVDKYVEFQHNVDVKDDNQMNEAIQWLYE